LQLLFELSSFAEGGGPAFACSFAFVIPHPEQSRKGEESAFVQLQLYSENHRNPSGNSSLAKSI
jgi:hypothetical protein